MTKARKGIPTLGGKSGAAMLGAAIGAAMSSVKNAGGGGGPEKIATTKKKKATKKKANKPDAELPRSKIRRVMGSSAASFGFSSFKPISHNPVVLSGRNICATLTTTAAGVVKLLNYHGTAPATNINGFNFDPTAASTTIANFQIFPGSIISMSTLFTNWRVRKAIIEYQPTQSSANGGSVAIGTMGNPVVATSAMQSVAYVAQIANSVHSSVWSPMRLDCLAGIPEVKRWLSVEDLVVTTESQGKQELPFSFWASSDVQAIGTWGYFYLDWEIEFKGLAPHTLITSQAASSQAVYNNEREEERKDDSVVPIGPGISYPLEVREVPPLSSSSQPSRMASVDDQTRASGGWFSSPQPARTSLQRATAQQ